MPSRALAFRGTVAAALLVVSSASSAQPAPATQPAADVPVKAVVLYSSGVGYFEHFGVVKGNAASELRFKSAQINDILKSLVLQDLDGGKISTISYPSQDPLEKTLRSFQVNITNNPPLADLLNQLRGAKVELTISGDKIAGTVLGVEKKMVVGADRDREREPVETYKVNLLTGTGANIKSIPLDNVSDVAIQDEKLQKELGQALAALAQARDQDKKPVQINFTGKGDRHVKVGYVVETPIWKTSYRLVLDTDVKAKPKLQGWAIVENQTDNDWTNVELSLVSGRPISFVQDLYRPLYLPRPVVKPNHYASLRPQVYDKGAAPATTPPAEANADADKTMTPRGGAGGAGGGRYGGGGGGAGGGGGLFGGGAAKDDDNDGVSDTPMDLTASIASAASAAKLGELFQYTVPNVSLPRQRSAMIPIVTDDVEAERVSIYNAKVLEKNPLVGARLKNTTKDKKHLLEGPITVFVDSRYAGDARIDNVPPGQERLISYGIDLEVNVISEGADGASAVRTARVERGNVVIVTKDVYTHKYQVENKSAKEKTLLIEQPIGDGKEEVVTPKPLEKTDKLYRFKETLPAGASKQISIREEVIREQFMALGPTELTQLEYYARMTEVPEKVKAAIAKAVEMRRGVAELERKIQAKTKALASIPADQTRIRENMKAVDKSNEYYNDLLKKLRAQETDIDTMNAELRQMRLDLELKQKGLEDYIKDLSI